MIAETEHPNEQQQMKPCIRKIAERQIPVEHVVNVQLHRDAMMHICSR